MRLLESLLCASVLLGSAAAQTARPIGPCSLLTKADVQQAAGSAASEGTVNNLNKSVCDFKVGEAGVVNISLVAKSPGDSAARTVAELKKRKISGEVAAGLGDGAYASSPGYGMQQLGVYKGQYHVIVTALLFGAPEAKTKAAVQALMKKALTKLP